MRLNAIKARLGAIGPSQMGNLGKGAKRLLEEDLPMLIAFAEATIKFIEEQPATYRGELDAFMEDLNGN